VALRDGQALVGHAAGAMAVSSGQGLQQRLHLRGKRMMWMIQHHRAAATQQMGQTSAIKWAR
jgi:hypothetical protein